MPASIVRTHDLLVPIAHFSHGIEFHDLVFVGAKGATDPRTTVTVLARGVSAAATQAERMFDNVATVLRLLGTDWRSGLQMNVYLTDWRYREAFEAACAKRVGDQRPAMTIVQSAAFAIPDLLLEVDLIAGGERVIKQPVLRDGQWVGIRAGDRFFSCGLRGTRGGAGDASTSAQSERALTSLLAAVEAAGMGEAGLGRVNVTLADPRHVPAFLGVWRRTLASPRPPLSLRCASLPDPNACVQVDGVADARGVERIGSPWADRGVGWPEGESAAARAGDLVWTAGMPPDDPARDRPGLHAVDATDHALDGVLGALGRLGCTAGDLLRVYAALADWRHYPEINIAYSNRIGPPYPPRSAVQALAVGTQPIHLDAVAGVHAGLEARLPAPPQDAPRLPREG